MNSGIYQIINTANGKRYIGSSVNIKKRLYSHFNDLRKGKHHNRHLQRAYVKYGEESFLHEIIEVVSQREMLLEREQYWMDTINPEYNINMYADSPVRKNQSEETRQKIREANLGIKHPEWRNKIKSQAQSGLNHWTNNKEFSEDSKLKMSASHKALYANGYKHPRCREVLKYNLQGVLLARYSSVKEAAQMNELNPATLLSHIKNGKTKHFIWKYGG